MENSGSAPVVAIGNFDGVHLGHQALLAAGQNLAVMQNRPLVAVTFEPHPRSFFQSGDAPFRITPEPVKERRLYLAGADRVDVLDFNGVMAALTPAQFIDMIIVGHLNAAHVVVGSDFHFGRDRAGHVDTLQADGRFQVTALTLENAGDAPVSSTRIRQALQAGEIEAANALLGWEWEIEGEVQQGDQRGRELGYPTANIPLGDTICPAMGIYAARVLADDIWHPAAVNIGIRPMFEVKTPLVEAHILDFKGDLYGQTLRVQPVRRMRGEAKFDTIDALKAQMQADCVQAREIIKSLR